MNFTQPRTNHFSLLCISTDIAKKLRDGLRDIGRARPDEITTREIRGYRVEPHNINAICVGQCGKDAKVIAPFVSDNMSGHKLCGRPMHSYFKATHTPQTCAPNAFLLGMASFYKTSVLQIYSTPGITQSVFYYSLPFY